MGNYNNFDGLALEAQGDGMVDSLPDPGGHTLEAGLIIAGTESFPVSFSAFGISVMMKDIMPIYRLTARAVSKIPGLVFLPAPRRTARPTRVITGPMTFK